MKNYRPQRGTRELASRMLDIELLKKLFEGNTNYKKQNIPENIKIENIMLSCIGDHIRVYTSIKEDVDEPYYYKYDEVIQQFKEGFYKVSTQEPHYKIEPWVLYILASTHTKYVKENLKSQSEFIDVPFEMLNNGVINKYLSILNPILDSFKFRYDINKLKDCMDLLRNKFLKDLNINNMNDLKLSMKNPKFYREINNYALSIPEKFKNEKVRNNYANHIYNNIKSYLNIGKNNSKIDIEDREV